LCSLTTEKRKERAGTRGDAMKSKQPEAAAAAILEHIG